MKNNVQIFDCTLRDGGYYTNWHFSDNLIQNYLKAIENAGIRFVETGFRFLEQNGNYGACAYCSDEFLKNFDIPVNLQIAVMIKAEELFSYGEKPEKALDRLFKDSQDSPVSIVRVAVPYQKVLKCQKILKILKNKGYKVILNLTKLFSDGENDIFPAIECIKDWNSFDVLYFADTFGNLTDEQVKYIILTAKDNIDKPLGFHSHNNKGTALANSLTAIKNGAGYIDSTITGMGRGAGNLETEIITKKLHGKYNHHALDSIIDKYFVTLKKE